jgi:hypothetical protein
VTPGSAKLAHDPPAPTIDERIIATREVGGIIRLRTGDRRIGVVGGDNELADQ